MANIKITAKTKSTLKATHMIINKNTFANDNFYQLMAKNHRARLKLYNSCVKLRNIYGGILIFLFIGTNLLMAPMRIVPTGYLLW